MAYNSYDSDDEIAGSDDELHRYYNGELDHDEDEPAEAQEEEIEQEPIEKDKDKGRKESTDDTLPPLQRYLHVDAQTENDIIFYTVLVVGVAIYFTMF